MTSSPAVQPPRRPLDLKSWLPSRHAIWWILGAFAAGLLIFALVLRKAEKDDFYRADPNAPTSAAPDYAPLPAPMAGESGQGIQPAAPATPSTEERPRLVEAPKPAPPVAKPESRPAAPTAITQPQPIHSPAPRYPSRALSRGDRGTVLVRAEVGPDGKPSDVGVANSSGSRELDRAAVEAVRRWRFRPAMNGEQPVTASVQVPIAFDP